MVIRGRGRDRTVPASFPMCGRAKHIRRGPSERHGSRVWDEVELQKGIEVSTTAARGHEVLGSLALSPICPNSAASVASGSTGLPWDQNQSRGFSPQSSVVVS